MVSFIEDIFGVKSSGESDEIKDEINEPSDSPPEEEYTQEDEDFDNAVEDFKEAQREEEDVWARYEREYAAREEEYEDRLDAEYERSRRERERLRDEYGRFISSADEERRRYYEARLTLEQEELSDKSEKRIRDIKRQKRKLDKSRYASAESRADMARNRQRNSSERAKNAKDRKRTKLSEKWKADGKKTTPDNNRKSRILMLVMMAATFLRRLWNRAKPTIMAWLENQPFYQSIKRTIDWLKEQWERYKPYIDKLIVKVEQLWNKVFGWAERFVEALSPTDVNNIQSFYNNAETPEQVEAAHARAENLIKGLNDEKKQFALSEYNDQIRDERLGRSRDWNDYVESAERNRTYIYQDASPTSEGDASASGGESAADVDFGANAAWLNDAQDDVAPERGGAEPQGGSVGVHIGGTTSTYTRNKMTIRQTLKACNQLN